MEKWSGRVALVTGANSGFGDEIARALVKAGMKVVGADINIDVMEKKAREYEPQPGSLTPVRCDLTKEKDVEGLFKTINEKFGGVDVCVNNAGICIPSTIIDGSPSDWKKCFDLNVTAYCLCSKFAVQSLIEKGKTDGQIINICSIAAHIQVEPAFNIYSATKYAAKFLTEGLRQEIIAKGYKIRVAEISPGLAKTNIFCNFDKELKDYVYDKYPSLPISEVAGLVVSILSCPTNVEINQIVIRAQGHA